MRITYLLLFVVTTLVSCDKNTNNPEWLIDVDQATELIHTWIFTEYNPEMNPDIDFSINEITTPDIIHYMKGQVFVIESSVPGLSNLAVFISDNVVHNIECNLLYGNTPPENLEVTDLNRDGTYELNYVITHGSGILRTGIRTYINNEIDTCLASEPFFLETLNYELTIKASDLYHLNFNFMMDNKVVASGIVQLIENDSVLALDLVFDTE